MNETLKSEYIGRICAMREIEKMKMKMVFEEVESARHDIGIFLEGDRQNANILEQAKSRLDLLYGFLNEFK